MAFWIKKTITVASSLYNLAGPESSRKNYLKGTVFSAVMANADSLATAITKAYFDGPGIRQRNFFNYAKRAQLAGLPDAKITSVSDVSEALVQPEIPVSPSPAGLEVAVQSAEVTSDFDPWIRRWIYANHPTRILEDWLSDYNSDTQQFLVQFPNGQAFTFNNDQAPIYNPSKRYINASYYEYLPNPAQDWVLGTPTSVNSKAILTGFTQESSTGTFTVHELQRTADITDEFSDGRPTQNFQEPANENVNLNTSVDVYTKRTVVDDTGISLEYLNERYTYTGTDYVTNDYANTTTSITEIEPGVFRTRTTVTTGEQRRERWDEQYDTQQEFIGQVVGGDQMFIYEIGSGNAVLDAVVTDVDASGFQEFFPFLPVRLNNKFIDEAPYEDGELYKETKTAWRRATNGENINEILDELKDNENIDDVDHAYIIWGVSLNSTDEAGKRYMYEFLNTLLTFQTTTKADLDTFTASIPGYNSELAAYENWINTDWTGVAEPPPQPDKPSISPPGVSEFQLTTNSPLFQGWDFDIRISWLTSEQITFNGKFNFETPLGNRSAREGEVQLKVGPEITWDEVEGSSTPLERKTNRIKSMYVYYQISDNQFRRIQIWGMRHDNVIYKGKSVLIDTTEALEDNDPSGFYLPLHNPTVRNMTMIDYTQLATANTHIMFNSYEVVSQNFLWVLIVIIIAIAIIIATSGGGAAAAGQASLAPAPAASISGLQAVNIGLSIVGTLVDFYVAASIARMQEQYQQGLVEYEEKMDYIEELMAELTNDLDFNPLFFTSSLYGNGGRQRIGGYTPELPDAFIQRTTMTGSDLLEISYGVVYDFVDVKKTLPRNLGDFYA